MNLLNCRKQKKPQGEMGIFVSYLWQNRKTRSLLLTVMRKHLMIHHSPHVGRKTTPKFSPGFRAIHLFLVPSSPWLLRGLERGRLESIPVFSQTVISRTQLEFQSWQLEIFLDNMSGIAHIHAALQPRVLSNLLLARSCLRPCTINIPSSCILFHALTQSMFAAARSP